MTVRPSAGRTSRSPAWSAEARRPAGADPAPPADRHLAHASDGRARAGTGRRGQLRVLDPDDDQARRRLARPDQARRGPPRQPLAPHPARRSVGPRQLAAPAALLAAGAPAARQSTRRVERHRRGSADARRWRATRRPVTPNLPPPSRVVQVDQPKWEGQRMNRTLFAAFAAAATVALIVPLVATRQASRPRAHQAEPGPDDRGRSERPGAGRGSDDDQRPAARPGQRRARRSSSARTRIRSAAATVQGRSRRPRPTRTATTRSRSRPQRAHELPDARHRPQPATQTSGPEIVHVADEDHAPRRPTARRTTARRSRSRARVGPAHEGLEVLLQRRRPSGHLEDDARASADSTPRTADEDTSIYTRRGRRSSATASGARASSATRTTSATSSRRIRHQRSVDEPSGC